MMRLVGVRQVWMGLAVALALAGPAYADVEAGKQAYAVCAACHGQQGEGNPALNAPRIAGMEPWYLRRQMEAFQQGLRGTKPGDTYGMQMRPMAMAVAAGALDELAAYVAALPDAPAPVTVDGDAAAGKAAFAVCGSCHGQQAEGLEAMGGPALAGQSDWYLVRQIQNYRKGLRGYDPKDIFGKQMQPMASTLTSDQAILDVVAHINTLR